jgi:hypothetical protein
MVNKISWGMVAPYDRFRRSLSLLTSWEIWNKRNVRVFRDKFAPPMVILDRIKELNLYVAKVLNMWVIWYGESSLVYNNFVAFLPSSLLIDWMSFQKKKKTSEVKLEFSWLLAWVAPLFLVYWQLVSLVVCTLRHDRYDSEVWTEVVLDFSDSTWMGGPSVLTWYHLFQFHILKACRTLHDFSWKLQFSVCVCMCRLFFSRKLKSLAFRCLDRKECYMYKPEKRTNTTP